MHVYIFPSTSLRNIQIAIDHKMWAVAAIEEPHATARITRSEQMPIGAAGLFYCSADPKVFTTPFFVESPPKGESVEGVWDETWYLPFNIRPLGDLSTQILLTHAHATWPVLEGVANATLALNLSGAMAFTRTWMPRYNWDVILEQLKIDAELYEHLV